MSRPTVGVSWVHDICGRYRAYVADSSEARYLEQIHPGRKVNSTFGKYTVVPSRYLIPLPERPTDQQLSPVLCVGVTAYKVLKVCGATSRQWIGISRSGGAVESMALQYTQSMGYRTTAIDAEEEKGVLSKAKRAGVYRCSPNERPSRGNSIPNERSVSAALAIAGKASAYEDALKSVAHCGSLVCIGIPPPTELVRCHPLLLVDNGIRVVRSMVDTRGDFRRPLTSTYQEEWYQVSSSSKLIRSSTF
ncbi:hypothetical protein BJX63DRAFT_403076 [Aspergillus granulosus]|uniref:Alcohol dehydrogenase-like C-terminal domain-containing protein n=1 Tax=Aspergillus granulosus TaxID=176169 RepID=A0ABR4H3Q6_9EURO